jgi:Domain of unknown function (DUF4920)
MSPLLAALVLSCPPGQSCEHASEASCASAPAAASEAKPSPEVVLRGEKLKGLEPVALAAVLERPDRYAGQTVAVQGTVRRACQKKGCWMELAASAQGPGVRVTFKDYGFFVPLDAAGRTAKVEGTVKVSELSAAQAEHLKAEGATVAAREVQLVASGVELRR